jgi:Spy/CpxP family protein refolding chaperone
MGKKICVAALVLLVCSANYVFAESGTKGGRDRDGSILDSLKLTPDQIEKVRKLRESYLKDKEPLRNQLFSKRMELKLLWMQTTSDPAKIKSKQKEIHDLKWKLKLKRTDYRLAFRAILTPEQLSKYIILKHDRKRRKKKGRRGW